MKVGFLDPWILDPILPAQATHVVANQFTSPGEAVANPPQSYSGWDAFIQRTGGIRTVEGIAMTQGIVAWLPE